MARKQVASKKALIENNHVVGAVFEFVNGTKLEIRFNQLPDSILEQLTGHGLLQKIGDAYSGSGGDVRTAIDQAEAVIASLTKGDWSTRGEGDGGMLLAALIEYFKGKQSEEAVRAKFKEMDDDEKKNLKKHPKIKLLMAQLQAERAAAAAEGADELEL